MACIDIENKDINKGKSKGVLLIIDDEVEVLESLKRVFARTYTLKLANTTKAAFDILEQSDVQVILCDQRMPDMKGTEFFAKIKESHEETIRILMTGYTSHDDVIIAINQGDVFRYLTKPWNLMELKNSVAQAFDQVHLIRENKRMIKELKEVNRKLEEKVKERTQEILRKNNELEALNDQLKKMATKDSLTGLNNTRTLVHVFEEKKKIAERLDLELQLVMIDLNHFKKVNDQQGHIAGDALLMDFASITNSSIREDFDEVFRVGGDEFLLLLLNCSEEKGHEIIGNIDTIFRSHTDISSVSHGIVTVDTSVEKTLKEWIAIADQRMYSDKNKNRGDGSGY